MDLYAIVSALVAERKRIDHLVQVLESFENGTGIPQAGTTRSPKARPARGRKSMGASEREEVSRRMKDYWASRRKAGGNSVGLPKQERN